MIGFAVVLIIFGLIFVLSSSGSSSSAVTQVDQLAVNGTPARGLVLSASSIATGVNMNGRRFDRRTVVLDVEVPGQAPYEINTDVLFPRGIVEALPGSSLELRVDPQNPSNVAVLGPGGLTGPWLANGPLGQMPPGMGGAAPGVPAAAPSKSGRVVGLILISAAIGLITLSIVTSASEGTGPKSASCKAAAKCCKALGRSECGAFDKMSTSNCKDAYESFRRIAKKQHVTCE